MGRIFHDIWKHFTKLDNNCGGKNIHPTVKCNFCSKIITSAQRTKNLGPHIYQCKKVPQDIKNDFGITPVKQKRAYSPRKRLKFTNSSSTTPQGKTSKQPSQIEMELAFAKMIYATGIPFRIVDDPSVKNFFSLLNPNFKLPTRQKLANKLLDITYESCRENVIQHVQNEPAISIVTDGWSNTNNQHIVNYMIASPNMKPVFWSSKNTSGYSNNGRYISDCINNTIRDIEIATKKNGIVCSIVTDNASSMKKAWEYVEEENVGVICNGCAAHGFNLLMGDVLLIEIISDILTKATSIAKFIRKSYLLLHQFRQKQKLMSNCSKHALSLPMNTRWYTSEKCIRSVVENQYIIQSIFDDDSLQVLNSSKSKLQEIKKIIYDQQFWDISKATLRLLEPINSCLALCEQDNSDISIIYVEYVNLMKHYAYNTPICPSQNTQFPHFISVQETIKTLIDTRMQTFITKSMKIATFLSNKVNPSIFGEDSIEEVLHGIELIAKIYSPSDSNASEDFIDNLRVNLEKWHRERLLKKLWDDEKHNRTSPSNFWLFKQPKADGMKVLREVAIQIFSIPTSSASSERCWSVHEFIHSKRRNRLAPEKVEKLVFIYSNLHALGDEENLVDHLQQDMYPDTFDSIEFSDIDDTIRETDNFNSGDEQGDYISALGISFVTPKSARRNARNTTPTPTRRSPRTPTPTRYQYKSLDSCKSS